MPLPADRPLRKVTLNLYEEDVRIAERYFSRGWTVHLREEWHRYMQAKKQTLPQPTKRTLQDLDEQTG